MKTFMNLVWLILGLPVAWVYFLVGIMCCCTVIGLPIGVGLIQLAELNLHPFGYAMADARDLEPGKKTNGVWEALSFVCRILYFPVGVVLALVTVVQAAVLCLPVVTIPLAMVLFKSLGAIFNPIHKKCVPVETAKLAELRKCERKLNPKPAI